jgi:hypothetical protein
MKRFSHLWQYLAEFFLEWEMFKTKCVEIKTQVLGSVTFFPKSHVAYKIMWKIVVKAEATNDIRIWRIRVYAG